MDIDERRKLARDPSNPPDVLDRLSHDPDWEVRWWAAENPSTPPEVLDRFSSDPHWDVRLKVAENTSTPFNALVRLSSDEHKWIRDLAWKAIEERGLIGLLGADED